MEAHTGQDGLRQSLDWMIARESGLEQRLAQLSHEAKEYLVAPAVISHLYSLVTEQREALHAHLRELGHTNIPLIGSPLSAVFETPPETQRDKQVKEAVAALLALAKAFTETAFGYAVLHALAHRSYEVATANLADQHRRNYLKVAQAIHQAVGDVAVQELNEAGHTCRCQCPSCGPGICICWHVHVDSDITGLGVPAEGIVVRAPRAGSNAELAGLRHADVILTVDGREVRSYQDMLDRMRDHEPGEDVKLRVRRGTGDPQDLMLTR